MSPPTAQEEPLLAQAVLDMKVLAETPDGGFTARLGPVADTYGSWIARQQERLDAGEDGLVPFRESGELALEGVAVLMRYTLRLLTLQQFQRATALVCACERLRQQALAEGYERWGGEPFRIGLWHSKAAGRRRQRLKACAVEGPAQEQDPRARSLRDGLPRATGAVPRLELDRPLA